MNNTEIAKKYGITEKTYFSDECLKFYSPVEREVFVFETTGLRNLLNSGYTQDDDPKYYTKSNNITKYFFNDKEYDVYSYDNCFTYYLFLCNEKYKKFRYIYLSDYKDFNGDGVYVYKDKYYCQYYEATQMLFVFNRNQIISWAAPFVFPDLKPGKSMELISKYFTMNGTHGENKDNTSEFYESDDATILDSFHVIYTKIMKEECKKANLSFKSDIENIENYIDQQDIDWANKLLAKQNFLFENTDYRNFCSEICPPDVFDKNLLKNGEVRKNLKNNFWIYHEFETSFKDSESDYIQGEDYTFLILNAIKALEYLLYRKISDYENKNDFYSFEEITEKTMLNKMINYISENKSKMIKTPTVVSKEQFDSFFKEYIELLYDVKDNCRNGYFHKDRIEKPKELKEKREKVLEAIAKTILIMK